MRNAGWIVAAAAVAGPVSAFELDIHSPSMDTRYLGTLTYLDIANGLIAMSATSRSADANDVIAWSRFDERVWNVQIYFPASETYLLLSLQCSGDSSGAMLSLRCLPSP